MATQVEFESPFGWTYGVYEEFPLNGGEPVPCLVIQPEDGSAVTRVKFDSPEADKFRKRFPALADLAAPAKEAPAADAPPAAA